MVDETTSRLGGTGSCQTPVVRVSQAARPSSASSVNAGATALLGKSRTRCGADIVSATSPLRNQREGKKSRSYVGPVLSVDVALTYSKNGPICTSGRRL